MFLDPIECKQAKDLLRQDAPLQAAQVLLKTSQPAHRRVQQLLLDVQRILIQKAEELWNKGQLEAAYEHLSMASRCGPLPGEADGLSKAVEAAKREAEIDQRRQQERVQQAQHLLAEGHLRTAENVLEVVSTPEAAPLQEEVRLRRRRLQDYIQEAYEHLAAKNDLAARECYRKAQRLSPRDPAVIALGESLVKSDEQGDKPPEKSAPIRARSTTFRLGGLGVVLSTTEITIGRAGQTVQLPLWGRLHARHAGLVHTRGQWQLVPHCDSKGSPCRVRVENQTITGPIILQSGSTVSFGHDGIHWQFTQPVAGSSTAILETDSLGPCTPLLSGSDQRRVILLIDECVLAAEPPAHLIVTDLPCQKLIFRWTADGLIYEVCGGRGFTLLPDGTFPADDPPPVYLPSEILVEETLDEAEWLGRVMTSRLPSDEWTLPLVPVDQAL